MRRREQPVAHPQGEPWCRVADVLAEYYGQDPNRGLDDDARALAEGMRGVRLDWADKPCVTWSAAKLLLEGMVAERLRVATERSEREARSDAIRATPPEPLAASPSTPRFPREYW